MTENNQDKPTFAIALHGGAGNLKKKNFTPEQENAYKYILDSALTLGYKMLQNDSPATDVVVAVIKILEDSPLFNAGKGSVFSNEGYNEMDAAIMEGENLKCGAVTNIRTVKNPITLAECIMKKSKFIFLNGEGAEKFAKENGITIVDSSYFFDQKRWDEMLQLRNTNKAVIDNDRSSIEPEEIDKYGTVGCVVLDKKGNLAAGTSTGGLTNKKYNRIGDSPLIGAGTYANNKTCAVSCTGRGEDFIRIVAAHQLHNYMSMKNYSLKKASRTVIREDLKNIKGRGGLIAVDSKGNISFQFNTSGMFRAGIDKNGTKTLEIYKLEPEK